MLFAACVSGYGHIAPKTLLGQVVTIAYAIFGIPLTLLTITNLGGFMASAFRFLYRNICCGLFCLPCKRKRLHKDSCGGGGASDVENGATTAAQPLTGAAADAVWVEGSEIVTKVTPPHRSTSSFLTWRQGLRRVMTTADNKRVSVPIYVSLLLIAGYIVAGALLFTLWEEDWNFFIGCYFSFITLTTIGFGDYVPGTSVDSWDSQEKLVLCALYLIVGLSLIAMCFDLMQEEVKNKCKSLGRSLGIIKDAEAQKQKRKRLEKRKRRKEKESQKKLAKRKSKLDKKQNGKEHVIEDMDVDSFKTRPGKSPLYERRPQDLHAAKTSQLAPPPKYTELPNQNNGQISISVQNEDDDEHRLDGNFEDFEPSKRPILWRKCPSDDVASSREQTPSLRGKSPSKRLREKSPNPRGKSPNPRGKTPNGSVNSLAVRESSPASNKLIFVDQNKEPIQIRIIPREQDPDV